MQQRKESGITETTIGTGTRIQGNLEGTSTVHVNGALEGNITVKGGVYVGEAGRVKGDISATSVVVEGEVHGNIQSAGKVQLGPNANLKGNIRARGLTVQDGAWFEGRISDAAEEAEPHRESMNRYAEAPVYQ